MRNLYINSRLHALLIAYRRNPRKWVFSRGEPWLLLTPDRLGRLADRLGLNDRRVDLLLNLVRRHEPEQPEYCRRLGVRKTRYVAPDEYPPAICPRCDHVHRPHPLDAWQICDKCREQTQLDRCQPSGRARRDMDDNRRALRRLREKHPDSFYRDELSPGCKFNPNRRVERDWSAAVNRILMGLSYRAVAREFDCSVGLLHKKVHERKTWENN